MIETFLLAMTPIGELRLALPSGVLIYGLDFKWAFLISVIGNLVPVVFLLLLLDPVSEILSRWIVFKRFFDWLFERTRKKSEERISKYGAIALISFVAIPLPFTGAWTGAIIAFLFNIPFKKAFPLISLGVIIAGVIVSILIKVGLLWLI